MDGDATDGDDDSGVRRSKRRRFKPLEWYKGEHYVFERRQSGVGLVIPTVARVERAGPPSPVRMTRPYRRRIPKRVTVPLPLPAKKLPKGLKFEKEGWADLYDSALDQVNRMHVVCRADEIEHRALPETDGEESGYAGQSFNLRTSMPFARWICGRVGLPPGAAKEAESVGDAVQVFRVISGQPQAIEVAFGLVDEDDFFDPDQATRFLLNPDDEFYVPARNAYYLKNHSPTVTCEMHFMILKRDSAAARKAELDATATEKKSKDKSKTEAKSGAVKKRRLKKKQEQPKSSDEEDADD